MDDNNQDYNSFEQYRYNHDVYMKIRGYIDANEFNSFPYDVLGDQTEYKHNITKDCLMLRKYLRNFNNEEECKNKNCCQYINYLLNKSVRKYYSSKSSIFHIYIKYMNLENNNNKIMNLCLPKIYYLDLDKYNKFDLLRTAYENCHYYISNKHSSTSCYYANLCARAYNNPKFEYINRDDIMFCKNLKHLKVILEENEPPLTSDCYLKFSDSLIYSYNCKDLLHNSEKINTSMQTTNMVLELQGSPGAQDIKNDTVGTDTLSNTLSGTNDIRAHPPRANSQPPVGIIIGTFLGFVLPLIIIYRVRKTYIKNNITLYEYLYYVMMKSYEK
ncbi:hypothetical protein PCYB_004120 [Plasmodium cynomolgi strain B]|uniref:CYIR protein n=1 Tax=Plasmodium cynomolgi (strain B) TaxID=1120755 RepID=K6UNN8_PLACD|nr:hypothetical protein PCYB_004120 [Plasmodium cynomolgi strain B]GAB69663.1 hypothetical protein PCYB_004120 [Plasmodium cynomolgi strain B]